MERIDVQLLPTTSASSISSPTKRFVHWPRSPFRRGLFVACYLAFLAAVAWIGCWGYWTWKTGKPLTTKASVWDHYYSELRQSGALDADIRPHDEYIDVVMLGASTIERGFGDVEGLLKTGLQRAFGDRVRVYNLAKIAHTSRDSVVKFSRIAGKPFDLILIYDGFNDCRMNNCRPDLFRDDYTHCAWYQSFERRRRAGTISLPREVLGDLGQAIGLGPPDENLMQYGGELKTPGPFRRNLEEILNASRPHNSLVLLQTFAYHIPADYTDDKFQRGELDYGTRPESGRCPLQMWGRPADVAKCTEAHNRIVRQLAKSHPDQTVFVDQDQLIPHAGRYFVDACHFTDEGCRQFVDNLLPAVVQRLRDAGAGRASFISTTKLKGSSD